MGSKNSGDDLVAGHDNGANGRTMLIGENGNFIRQGIFVVTPTGDYSIWPHGGGYYPIDGVVGVSCGGDGAGVRGIGNQPGGVRAPFEGTGTGGDGVVGHGGSGDLEKNITSEPSSGYNGPTEWFDPGRGVLGIGGYWLGPKSARGRTRDTKGGPGVVGVAGWENQPPAVPTLEQSKGVGVMGVSSIGIGVVGDGIEAGVSGHGKQGPGGTFSRDFAELKNSPQVHIEPQPMPTPAEKQTAKFQSIDPREVDLPIVARAGDLLVTQHTSDKAGRVVDPRGSALLWFCTKSTGQDDPAIWRQVLMGPEIEGKR